MFADRPFLRLLILSLATVFTLVLALFALRLVALSGPIPQVTIPLPTPVLFAASDLDKGPLYSQPGFDSIFSMGDRVIPAFELRVSRDQEWIVYGSGPLEELTTGQGAVERHNWEELSALSFKDGPSELRLLRLKDLLAQNRAEKALFIVHNQEVAAASALVKLLGERDDPMVTLIFAPAHRMNRELRKLRAYWYFGGDAVMRTQWRLFSSLALSPLASSDFEWLPEEKNNSVSQEPDGFEDELKRRKIPRVLWVNESATINELPKENYLGFMTYRPTAALSLIRVDPSDKSR